jgi:hypothetical protein
VRKKALLPGDEREGVERGWVEFDRLAVDEVADFDWGDRPRWDIGHGAKVNSLFFATVIINEDRAAVVVDFAGPVAHAHRYRNALPVARKRAPIRLPADPARPAPVDAT